MTDLSLPVGAERLVPHRRPMRMVDLLVAFRPGYGVAEAVVSPENPLAAPDGALEPEALIELMAQGYAALKGYDDLLHHRPVRRGFLVGIQSLRVAGTARVGDRLRIVVETVKALEPFYVAAGEVTKDRVGIASATLKLWTPTDG